MKKPFYMLMVLILVLSCTALVACGGGDDDDDEQSNGTSSEVTSEETSATSDETSGTSGEGCSDVPKYPGASDTEASWNWGAGQFGENAEAEWHYYTTDDDPSDVIDYYKDEMPDEGWQEVMSMDYDEYAMTIWMKDEGTVAGIGGRGGRLRVVSDLLSPHLPKRLR